MTRAVVVAALPGSATVVAGLPLAERIGLALRRAGLVDVLMLGSRDTADLRSRLARRRAGVRWVTTAVDAGEPPSPGGVLPVLVIAGNVLFDEEALAPLLRGRVPDGSDVSPAREPGRGRTVAVLCHAAAAPALLGALEGGAESLDEAARRAGLRAGESMALDRGLALPLDAAPSAVHLETALLDHLGRRATGDSYLATLIDRRLSRPITRLLLPWPVTPSQITLSSILVGLAGAALLATVSYWARLAGLAGLVASIVLDCVDGEVARARFEQSAAGARLDVVGDYAVHLATFTGLGVGLVRQGLPPGGVLAVVVLVAGVVAAMVTVHALFVRPALAHGDLHWAGAARSLSGMPAAAIAEKLASRDYTYLLLGLGIVGHLEWFLYAAAAGSWLFVAALVGFRAHARRAARQPVASR